jgi:hypothetical protein
MAQVKTLGWIVFGCALLILAGCSSNTSSSSGYGSGSGYIMSITATNTTIPYGGSSTLIVSVKDPVGNPVNDTSIKVTFSSTQGGTFDPATAPDLVGGLTTVIYKSPALSTTTTQTSVVDQITASYRGAFAYVSIYVYKP